MRRKRPTCDSSDEESNEKPNCRGNSTSFKGSILQNILSTKNVLQDSSKVSANAQQIYNLNSLDSDLSSKRKKLRPFNDSDSSDDEINSIIAKQLHKPSEIFFENAKKVEASYVESKVESKETESMKHNQSMKTSSISRSNCSDRRELSSPLIENKLNYDCLSPTIKSTELYPTFENLQEKHETVEIELSVSAQWSLLSAKWDNPSPLLNEGPLQLSLVAKRRCTTTFPVLKSAIPASVARYIFDYQIFSIKWLWQKVYLLAFGN